MRIDHLIEEARNLREELADYLTPKRGRHHKPVLVTGYLVRTYYRNRPTRSKKLTLKLIEGGRR